jgi:cobaltochelatase CobN
MHRTATISGESTSIENTIFVEQTPAPIVIITSADTDLQALAQVWAQMPAGFPEVRALNILAVQQQVVIDTYAEEVLAQAKVIVVRLLGGVGYWSYGLEVVRELATANGIALILIPGDDQPDLSLLSRSTVPLDDVNQFWRYWIAGGTENLRQSLYFLAQRYLEMDCDYLPPAVVPKAGIAPVRQHDQINRRQVAILFYRAHYLVGNMAAVNALCDALIDRKLTPLPIFVSSLRDPEVQTALLEYCQSTVDVILNTTSFSLIAPAPLYPAVQKELDTNELWAKLDLPILQVITSGGSVTDWQESLMGLSPSDNAMNIALPEVDGRIISRAVSFKALQSRHPVLQTDVLGYQPVADRIQFVADLAANWVKLRQTPPSEQKIALVLANYPNRDGRLANGVGLDTPQSCVEILKALQAAGYITTDLPADGDELIRWLTKGVTNDPEGRSIRPVLQQLEISAYLEFFQGLPEEVRSAMNQRWGAANSDLPVPGIQLGNIFIGVQPARGYDRDPNLNYHAPDLEPTHDYLAFYEWIRNSFGTQAIVHVGKHGNLEWLPGKSVALSAECYPEIALGAMPHFYPFIVNDPGEGSQAKRRSQAVILDHLTPPMTRAELYGDMQNLENLVDEYYEAMSLNPGRMVGLQQKIVELLANSNLREDFGITANELQQRFGDTVLNHLDRSLCELKEAQIRDGLHILGCCPTGDQLRDLIISIARHPQAGRLGLSKAIALDNNYDFDPLTADPAQALDGNKRTVGQAIADIEFQATKLIQQLLERNSGRQKDKITRDSIEHPHPQPLSHGGRGGPEHKVKSLSLAAMVKSSTQVELEWIDRFLIPSLYQTTQEITNLIHGLSGGYIPAGPSGAPTRGRPEVLPTGRNFYSVDIRAVPTESAWDVGRRAAETLVERYTQENGEYPKTLGLSIWGTATMRTGGDDLAEALALLGVRPLWDGASRRVVDFEILPLAILGRPRVDVTLRVSGFFRDAFPNLIELFDRAVVAVASLDEPADMNPLADQVQKETQAGLAAGLEISTALDRASYRVFGSKPGAYGAGLQGLIDNQNWESDRDLAAAYINWSSYAYRGAGVGMAAPEAFQQRLAGMQIVLQNQDNREHDLLDSDDYYQFQGGLTAAIKTISGNVPTVYCGDNSTMAQPKVRTLNEEIAKVYRSRVVNPKWIEGAMRHGYKGAAEMAATMDFLFAYDATTSCVADHMYEGVAEAYLLDPKVQEFMERCNPWAARDIADRLLEANQRGMWSGADSKMLDQLQEISLTMEAEVEGTLINESIAFGASSTVGIS